jgi:PAS domain-containing protein
MGHKRVIELAAGFCAVVGVTLGGLLTWTTVKLHKTRLAYTACKRARAEALAVLDTVPLAAFRWPAGRDPEGYSVQTIAYSKFLAELAPGDAMQLEAARLVLHQDGGAPFSLPVRLRGGGEFVIEGRRAASGETVLWLLDGDAAALARQVGEEAASLRELIDAIQVPIWRRGRDRALVDCNNAYAAALDAPRALVLAEGRELAPAGGLEKALGSATDPDRRSSHRHVVIGGSRRLLDIIELPCPDGGAIGFAFDRTDVEIAETDLRRHAAAHAETLESIGAAVAIYGADSG